MNPRPSGYEPDEVPLRAGEPRSSTIISVVMNLNDCQPMMCSAGLCQAVGHQLGTSGAFRLMPSEERP